MSDYLKKRQEHILSGRPLKEKKQYTIPKKSEKRKQKEKEEREARGKDEETMLVKWFKGRMKYMGYSCKECGAIIETGIYKYAINHICHILPKRANMCPSTALHPMNFITLCQHHHNLFDSYGYDDKGWAEREKWSCWPLVRERLIMVYPDLDPSEHRHFPESVLKYMEENKPF